MIIVWKCYWMLWIFTSIRIANPCFCIIQVPRVCPVFRARWDRVAPRAGTVSRALRGRRASTVFRVREAWPEGTVITEYLVRPRPQSHRITGYLSMLVPSHLNPPPPPYIAKEINPHFGYWLIIIIIPLAITKKKKHPTPFPGRSRSRNLAVSATPKYIFSRENAACHPSICIRVGG